MNPRVSSVTRACKVTTSLSLKIRIERDLHDPISQVLGRELNIRIADENAAAERLEDANDLGPDVPIPDHADRHFRQFLAGQIGAVEITTPFARDADFHALL